MSVKEEFSACTLAERALIKFAVFSRSEPYEGEDVDKLLLEVRDPTLDPPRRPVVPQTCHPLVQALMQVPLVTNTFSHKSLTNQGSLEP